MYVCLFVCLFVCLYACYNKSVYVCVYLCIFVCVCEGTICKGLVNLDLQIIAQCKDLYMLVQQHKRVWQS